MIIYVYFLCNPTNNERKCNQQIVNEIYILKGKWTKRKLGAKKNTAIRMNELTRKKIYETNSMVIEAWILHTCFCAALLLRHEKIVIKKNDHIDSYNVCTKCW